LRCWRRSRGCLWCGRCHRSSCGTAIANAGENGSYLDGLVFGDEDFFDDSGNRRGNFGVDFIRGDLH
jgi:hypothetical protein